MFCCPKRTSWQPITPARIRLPIPKISGSGTAGGLIFVASNGDGYIHAFDKDTGKILWKTEIEANPDGIPSVYEVGGRQYVAFYAAGGGGDGVVTKRSKPEAQGYYVFALPNSDSKSKKKGD